MVARGREEYLGTRVDLTSHPISIYPVLRIPGPGAILNQLINLGIRRHPPFVAKQNHCNIVLRIKLSFVIDNTIVSVRIVLSQFGIRTIAPFIV